MSYLDTADLVSRVKIRLNRPATDEFMTHASTDDVIYDALTAEQSDLVKWAAARAPESLWSAPTQLTTADSGRYYTFGTASGFPTSFTDVVPLGHVKLYASRRHIPDSPLVEGIDFTMEGALVRIPNYQTRTFSDGAPWAQWFALPATIASGTEPTLPMIWREALVPGACARIQRERLASDPTLMLDARDEARMTALEAVRTQAAAKGGLAITQRSADSVRRAYRYSR